MSFIMFAALSLSKWAEQRVEIRNLTLSLQVKKMSLESSKSRFNVLEAIGAKKAV